MATYVIPSRFAPHAMKEPQDLKKLADAVSGKIKAECPGIHWRQSYATLGRFDVVDIVEAEDRKEVQKAVMLIRGYGHCHTETLAATPWKEFLAEL
jgi:uncharacterized protein with GYD domain